MESSLLLKLHTQSILHYALHIPCQLFLSCVSSDNFFNVCASFERSSLIPSLVKSCLTVCIRVVFGLPLGRPWRSQNWKSERVRRVITGRKLPCNVRVVAKRTKTCGSFKDLKLTHDKNTTTTLYTIQTEVINDILVSSPITAWSGAWL